MNCARCGAENREARRFCGECGAPLPVTCGTCRFTNQPGEKFCGGCGTALPGAGSTSPAGIIPPETRIPPHLAEKILTVRSTLEGERKQVTVLFADLKGSMELLADRDPEEARKLLDPVLEQMMDAVHRYEGTVNQVMGDGIMALFGAPVAHEDHAVRACYAALDMQRAIRRYAEEIRASHGVGGIAIRVGLNSGEVVVREIASDLRMDYSAVGQTTHLAARMEQLAAPGSVLLTPDVLRLAEGYVDARPLGPVPVKGLAAPLEVFELAGAGPRRSRLHAAASRGLTRFVGRDRELESLREALARAAAGRGQVVALVGEPGVGKSRLVWEVTHSHRTHGWLVLQASSVSYGKASPYLPVIDLLKGYLRIDDRDDARRIREKVTGKVLALDEALRPAMPALLALLGVPVEEPQWEALDPRGRRERTVDAVRRVVVRESRAEPVLLVFEDLHWVDDDTQAVLDALVEALPAARILLLVNYRPEYAPRWGSKSYYTQLRLDPLPPESAGELLRALLGPDAAGEVLVARLVERTEGNPFFLEECVRTLVETGALAGERGAYRLAKPVERVQVPATVQTLLAARIDRLPAGEKHLLQAASVIGKNVPYALLHALVSVPEEALRAGVARLQSAEFLYEASLFPVLEYTFKHALTHEVAYGGLLHDRRTALHAQVVRALGGLAGARWPEHAETLAHHAVRGEVWDRAVDALLEASRRAYGRGAVSECLRHLEQARELLPRLPAGPDTTRRAVDVRAQLYMPLVVVGQLARAAGLLREAEALARELDDRPRLGFVLVRLGIGALMAGEYAETLDRGGRALAIGTATGDTDLRIRASYLVGFGHLARGEIDRAFEFLTPLADGPDREGAQRLVGLFGDLYVTSCGWLAYAAVMRGEFDRAFGYADRAVEGADASGIPQSVTYAAAIRGFVSASWGDPAAGLPWLERAVEIAERHGAVYWLSIAQIWRGRALALAGGAADGLQAIEQAMALREQIGTQAVAAMAAGARAEALLAGGRVEEAGHAADQALEMAVAQGERLSEALALVLKGDIASAEREGDAWSAGETYERGIRLAREIGARPMEAHAHLGLGRLHARRGDRGKAEEHLRTAAAMFREMGMDSWLSQAEAARRAGSAR